MSYQAYQDKLREYMAAMAAASGASTTQKKPVSQANAGGGGGGTAGTVGGTAALTATKLGGKALVNALLGGLGSSAAGSTAVGAAMAPGAAASQVAGWGAGLGSGIGGGAAAGGAGGGLAAGGSAAGLSGAGAGVGSGVASGTATGGSAAAAGGVGSAAAGAAFLATPIIAGMIARHFIDDKHPERKYKWDEINKARFSQQLPGFQNLSEEQQKAIVDKAHASGFLRLPGYATKEGVTVQKGFDHIGTPMNFMDQLEEQKARGLMGDQMDKRTLRQQVDDNPLLLRNKKFMDFLNFAEGQPLTSQTSPLAAALSSQVTAVPRLPAEMAPIVSTKPVVLLPSRSKTLSPGIGKDGKRISYGAAKN
jgi:hypothetical protein